MSKIPVTWKMDGKIPERGSSSAFSKFMLNPEWLMTCWFTFGNPNVPDFIEIRRKCHSKNCYISGKLELHREVPSEEMPRIYWKREVSIFFEPGCAIKNLEIPYDVITPRLSIVGYIIISDNVEKSACVIRKVNDEKDIQLKFLNELSNDLERLLNPETASFEDVHLKCGSVAIPAHKLILSMRSPVFSAMFSSEMEETRKNEVDITDVEVPVLRMMLKYIYTGKVENLTISLVEDLLFAAEKYQLKGLKTRCSDYLKSTVSIENVLGILSLGDLHDPDLKVFAMDFICEKCDEFPALERTEEWKNLLKEKLPLALEVLTSLVKSKGK
ncbi:speckle-type POZ protein [Nephila pilipes]|uniref:Speckle-type POZ protein n=1 Tax=Nephila pilipes TaxID=299642 RepID=A0A8X6NJ12_NEPPI|nr:speckle-type POZ protein [Nephila pilipes]